MTKKDVHSDIAKIFNELLPRIDLQNKLLALIATQNEQADNKKRMWILRSIGFQPKEIAEMLGTTPNYVSKILSEIRKEKDEK